METSDFGFGLEPGDLVGHTPHRIEVCQTIVP